MSKIQKVITNFGGMSETEFPDAVMNIITELTKNSGDFPDLPSKPVDMAAAREDYESIRLAPYYAAQSADLGASRKVIQSMVKKNGNYINTLANGNLVLLEESGYPISKPPSKQGVLAQTTLKLSVVNEPGQLTYDITGAIVNHITFAIFYTPVTNTETNPFKWQFLYCPKRKGVIMSLPSKVDFKFVSVALGTNPVLRLSDVVIKSAI